MKVGLMRLGKMGFNLALNIKDHGHEPVVYDRIVDKVKEVESERLNVA
ncbi:NAD(P)-binding domain-containing protein [Clostridium thermarum]|nr:NAD(P)-binding domain-containing protein [Clostridium thermarum]